MSNHWKNCLKTNFIDFQQVHYVIQFPIKIFPNNGTLILGIYSTILIGMKLIKNNNIYVSQHIDTWQTAVALFYGCIIVHYFNVSSDPKKNKYTLCLYWNMLLNQISSRFAHYWNYWLI